MRKQIVLLAAAISLAASATRIGSAAVSEPAGLPNGGVWKDADGVRINAHGGGLLKDGDTWYWYGEHKVAGRAGNRAQVGVGCYSSRDLVTWKNEGIALRVSNEEGHDIEKDCILERPKVVKAPATGKYAMLFHLERKGRGYNDARVGFAVSDSPIGPFTFVRSCRPVDGKMMSRDMTVFIDDDGSVWHIFASKSNATLHFAELTGDCLGYTGRWHRGAEKHWTEAPAVVKHGGWYWLLGSGCTGWKPNAARIYRAKSLTGPWEWMGNPCTGVNGANMLGADKTWGGQSTFIFHDGNTGRDVACFDIWNPKDAIDGRYVWLPITWHGDGLPEIPWRDEWTANDRDDLTLRGGPNSIWGVYQWGVEVDGFVHRETKKPARAYLWIPPKTKRVKAVVIGNDNMLEEPLFSDADFRRTLAAADVAIIFVTPGLMGFNEKFTEADVPALDALLEKLAKASGHKELAKDAQIVPLGHSAWADWPYLCTAAMPQRVKCAVSLKGSWPHFKPQFDGAFWRKTAGVPMLLVGGDYEWFSERMDKERRFLKSHPNVKLHPVADWESGHFDMTDALPLAIARFITVGTVPSIPRFGGKFTVLGFEDRAGEIVAQDPKNHLQVKVPFRPTGEGFRAKARFDEKIPPGRPERWTGKKAGEANGVPGMPREAIDVKVVQGPAVKTGMDTFDIRFNRHGFDGYRAREVVLAAVYPGDAHWRRSVQQAILRFPVNTHGAENTIEWNPPKSGRGGPLGICGHGGPPPRKGVKTLDFPLKLTAKATSGLPVRYFVREGPAVVGDDGELRLRDWPFGAKSCEITVCAYQWGADGGKVKTAEPVCVGLTVSR